MSNHVDFDIRAILDQLRDSPVVKIKDEKLVCTRDRNDLVTLVQLFI